MQLNFIKLNRSSLDLEAFARINDEAFPPSEHMSIDEILDFAESTNTDFLGIRDGYAPVGFFLLLKNDRMGYIFFYAIGSDYRSKGYGGAAIKKLIEEYNDLQIVLDFENIDEAAENFEQRVRRKSFYLRNGFCETGRYTMLGTELFEVVCSEQTLNVDALLDIIAVISSKRENFPNILV